MGYDADLINKEKNSENSRMLFGENPVVKKKKNEQLYASFLKFHSGKPLAFVDSEEKAGSFIRDYLAFHKESLDIPASKKREGREGILKNESLRRPDRDAARGDTRPVPGMIFFNRESGIQMAFGLNDLVPDPDNASYREESTVDVSDSESDTESGHEAMRLLYSSHISGDWMHYLVNNYDIPGIDFPGEGGREFLMDNLDFMLRFWKRKNYYP